MAMSKADSSQADDTISDVTAHASSLPEDSLSTLGHVADNIEQKLEEGLAVAEEKLGKFVNGFDNFLKRL